MNAETGVIVVGDQTIGFTERLTHLEWDIPADVITEITCTVEDPFYLFYSTRYFLYNYILTVYNTRWFTFEVSDEPFSEVPVMLEPMQREVSERRIYYYPDTSERIILVESLYTVTPLLLKYPKYFNWNYIPQIINPEFIIWSYYPLQENDITLKIIGDTGVVLYYNSGTSPDSFIIEKTMEQVNSNVYVPPRFTPPESTVARYKITVIVDHTFENGEVVDCYLTIFDVMGNHLKDGMW